MMGSQSLQEICQRVDQTYKLFFKKQGGRPGFHKTTGCGSFMFKGHVGYTLVNNTIRINKLGYTYKFKLTREYGTVKNVHIKRDNMGYLWLIVTTEKQPEHYDRLGNASIGMDFGLKHFITMSNGDVIDNPQAYKQSINKLRRLQRNVSHKVKGSNGRKKAVKHLAKQHAKVANQRSDFHWKLSHSLCKQYSYIAIEDLNMKGMQKLWGRKISDLGWYEFIQKLQCVAEKYGTQVVKIGRYEASSQICHCCGYRNPGTKELVVREWVCPVCGKHHDRDINAAINILNIATGKGVSQDRSNSKTLDACADNAVAMIVEDSHRL